MRLQGDADLVLEHLFYLFAGIAVPEPEAPFAVQRQTELGKAIADRPGILVVEIHEGKSEFPVCEVFGVRIHIHPRPAAEDDGAYRRILIYGDKIRIFQKSEHLVVDIPHVAADQREK